MGIPQKMRSETELEINDIDLTTMLDVTVRASQDGNLFDTIATVIDAHTLVMGITLDKAANLIKGRPVQLQILYTNADGKPGYSEIKTVKVDEILGGTYGD